MNILITGAWANAEDHIPALRQDGHSIQFMQWENEALPCPPSWVEGIICNGLFLHHPINSFPNLRYIQLTSSGYDRVNMEYIQSHHIRIHNAGGIYATPMAELTIAGVLALYKKFHFFAINQQNRLWGKNRFIPELMGKNVCIVGCGHYGRACAHLFHAFGCNVTGITRTHRQLPASFSRCALMKNLNQEVAQADIVILALPADRKTQHIAGKDLFSCMNAEAILVNMARGSLINTQDLVNALTSGQIQGAVLDVFETEPLPSDSPLWDLPNVIITPHNSYAGEGNAMRLNREIYKNINQFSHS